MKSLHRMLLAILIIAVVTALSSCQLSSYVLECPSQGEVDTCRSSLIIIDRIDSSAIQFRDTDFNKVSRSLQEPTTTAPLTTTALELLRHDVIACTLSIGSRSLTKGHIDQCAVCVNYDLNTHDSTLLYTVSGRILAVDPTLDIPLNKGPTT